MPIVLEMGAPGKEGEKGMDDMQVHEALHVLLDACEIQKNPELMAKVRALAEKKKQKLTSIQGLKEHYNEKYNKPAEKGFSEEEEPSDAEEPPEKE